MELNEQLIIKLVFTAFPAPFGKMCTLLILKIFAEKCSFLPSAYLAMLLCADISDFYN